VIYQPIPNSQNGTIADNPKEVRGKYFRIVGRLIADGVDISDLLIQRHLAVLYDGGTKSKDWCGFPKVE